MTKNKRLWKVPALLFLLASLLSMHTQVTAQQEDIPVNTIIIENPTNFGIQFSLKNDYTEWVSFQLWAWTTDKYFKKNRIMFVSSNGIVKRYDLEYRTKYVFGWNQKGEFDIFKVSK
ncbi:MAG: hypothetical protein WA584_09905 [Pyrinomonadaceae bacterium]